METVLTFYNEAVDSIRRMDLTLLYVFSSVYFVTAILVFFILFYGITAPYGRYARGGWGIFVNGKFAWFVQEIPSFAIPVVFVLYDQNALKYNVMPNMLFFMLYSSHYFQRACIFPFLIKGGKPTPFIPFLMALIFCLVNGYLQSAYLLHHAEYGPDWWTKPHIYIGCFMFVFGMAVNIHSDHILRNLRKPGETGYKIPKGGMFNFVSGANFFGEILEWAGFAIATWCIPALAFSFFTCCNIGPRAWQHHQYYLQKFEDYPKDRKAVIPFIL
ncbi:3-oxo-5-alpha-steroid 4-dehydrogenase 1-like [Ruditapes philippinarum]|uniref:3-oxo-5-alpha-steroid 4-dehydrogenase 1-like n=1 Tax=Ruditapes philippinarum TaxID=129788 RepID=UPI00295BEAA5|nr:3-oxo-5-alpha-steroid 4-dehydrogenase 1-like [Ruditapes philippinarum]